MMRTGLSAAPLCALLAGALLAVPQLASSTDRGGPRCTLEDGILTVMVPKESPIADVAREGDEIRVGTSRAKRERCAGSVPTVFNTDRIVVRGGARDFGLLALDMTDGPLAPGRTDEGDGSSEIELRIRQRGPVEFFIFGSEGNDHYSFGVRRHRLAVNFNADEAAPDIDMLARTGILPLIGAGLGDDVMTARGQRPISRPWRSGLAISGHEGDDVLIGARGRDSLRGRQGEDLMKAGAGRDFVTADGKEPDRVRCGKGRDRANVHRRDDVRGCEKLRVRK